MKHTWRTRGVYYWRAKKPNAVFGLSSRYLALVAVVLGIGLYAAGGWWWLAPLVLIFSGRHGAYIGQTSSRRHRDRQHLQGDWAGGVLPAPWSDLKAKAYPLPSLPWWKWSRELSERFWVAVLCPVYNVQLQPPWNLRKISKPRARAAREARDKRRRENPGQQLLVDILVTSVRLGLGLGILGVWAFYNMITR